MNQPESKQSNPPEHLEPGPYRVPFRNWLLLGILLGLLLLKYWVIFGERLPWYGYLGGSLLYLAIPLCAGRIGWKITGEKPYWGDNVFIGVGAILFVVLSIPAYAIGLR